MQLKNDLFKNAWLMKTFVPLVLFLVSDALHARSVTPQKVYNSTQLPVLIKKAKTDTALSEERAAAMLFHDLMNGFRKENNLDTIPFNDSLWLTARNHCVWMQRNNALEHRQKSGSELFSGETMYSRYDFIVRGKNTRLVCASENIARGGVSAAGDRNSRVWDMAEWALGTWKNSADHKTNMLNPATFLHHGVSFLIDNERGTVWVADVYARDIKKSLAPVANKPAPVIEPVENTPVVVGTPKEQPKEVVETATPVVYEQQVSAENFSTMKTRKALLPLLYAGMGKKKEDVVALAAMNHAKYLASAKDSCTEEKKGKSYYTGKNVHSRVVNAAKTFHKNKYRKMTYNEEIVYIEMPVSEYNEKAIAARLRKTLEAGSRERDKAPTYVGYGIEVKKTRDIVKIWAVRVDADAKNEDNPDF